MSVTARRSLALLLSAMLVLVAGAATSAAADQAPQPELHPPDGQTAVKPSDVVTFGGSIDPEASIDAGHLVFFTASEDRLPDELLVTGSSVSESRRLKADESGALSGSWQLSESTVPDDAAFVALEVDVTQPSGGTATGRSELLGVDRIRPYIEGAALVDPRGIEVHFNEPVTYPRAIEEPSAWVVDGSRQVLHIQGSGDTRSLTLTSALDEDATPTVEFRPIEGTLSPVHRDGAGWTLDSNQAQRSATALDRILPAVPAITHINGEDAGEVVHGTDATPVVRVGEIRAGHRANLYLETDGVNGFSDGDDPIGSGEATEAADGTYAEIATDALGDASHTIYAEAVDPSDNVSDGADDAAYVIDRVAPTPVTAVLDPDEIGNDAVVGVFLSEPVSGSNGASQWTLSGCVGGCPAILGVTGSDGSSDRRLQADGPVPVGAEVAWNPPASDPYRDAAGNQMAAFSGLDVQIELPAFLEALPAGNFSEGGPGGSSSATFTVRLTRAQTFPAVVTWRTEDGTAKAAGDYDSSSGVVTFLPGQTEQEVSVPIEDDAMDEHDETFFIVLEEAEGAPVRDEGRRASATIIDDDPAVGVGIGDDVRVSETDAATHVTLPIRLEAVSGKQVTVSWSTAPGSASSGSDFTSASGTTTFEPGTTGRPVTIDIVGDGDAEPDETFELTLSNPTSATITRPTATITIVNDDLSVVDLACPPDQVRSIDFDDVSGTHAANIACASWYAITLGKGDIDGDGRPEYDPLGHVTRAQMASFVARLLVEGGVALPPNPPNAFEDDDDSVHRTAIDQLAELGVVKGRADDGDRDRDGDRSEILYFPHDDVTRAQMASFIARGHAEAAGPLPSGPNGFDDDDRSVHHGNINAIAAAGITHGRQDTGDADRDGDTSELLYFPHEAVSRAQMASFLLRDLGVLVDDGVAYVGGADTVMTEDTAPPGGEVSGQVRSHKQVVSLVADGCGIDDRNVSVDGDGNFAITIPSSQPSGTCTLELSVTTRRAGSNTEQPVTHLEAVTVS